MPDKERVSVLLNSNRYEAWKTVALHFSIDEVTPSFTLEYALKSNETSDSISLSEGDVIEIFIGSTKVLTGYVDDPVEDYDKTSHTISVTGRAKTEDPVDCAALYGTGTIRGKDFVELAELLCKPFGISVSADPLVEELSDIIPKFVIQDGETVIEALNEEARKIGILMQTDANGNLVLGRASRIPLPGVAIRSGENLLGASFRRSQRDRFSDYIFKGQGPGDDNTHGSAASQMEFSIKDSDVKRYRPFKVVDHNASLKTLRQRAIWERNTRAGRGIQYIARVRGWRNVLGVWMPNTVVRVDDDVYGIDDNMLISSVDLTRERRGGHLATIATVPVGTYDVLKPPKSPRRKKSRRSAKLAAALATLIGTPDKASRARLSNQ